VEHAWGGISLIDLNGWLQSMAALKTPRVRLSVLPDTWVQQEGELLHPIHLHPSSVWFLMSVAKYISVVLVSGFSCFYLLECFYLAPL
jgi:hypothetical protein